VFYNAYKHMKRLRVASWTRVLQHSWADVVNATVINSSAAINTLAHWCAHVMRCINWRYLHVFHWPILVVVQCRLTTVVLRISYYH